MMPKRSSVAPSSSCAAPRSPQVRIVSSSRDMACGLCSRGQLGGSPKRVEQRRLKDRPEVGRCGGRPKSKPASVSQSLDLDEDRCHPLLHVAGPSLGIRPQIVAPVRALGGPDVSAAAARTCGSFCPMPRADLMRAPCRVSARHALGSRRRACGVAMVSASTVR